MIPSEVTLSCPIDYPYGLSSTKVRQHQTLSIIRRGATAVDLVVNPVYLLNENRGQLIDDITTHQSICNDNSIPLRLMLEYRHFSNEIYADMIKICRILDIQYVFPSTGHFADDYMDNLIMGKLVKSQNSGVKVITNGNIWKKEHYETIEQSEIYGMRLKSQYNLDLLAKSGV